MHERRVVRLRAHADFDEWRDRARELLIDVVLPENVTWCEPDADSLFASDPPALRETAPLETPPAADGPRVPRRYVSLATHVLAHRDPQRFALLYRMLWRLTHGDSHLLDAITDGDVHRALTWQSAIRRDLHKMKAFVRFREIAADDGAPAFVSWFEPEHYILDLVAPFFVRRFTAMRWSILTPYRSAHWDGQTLRFAAGAMRSDAPDGDALESVWRTYYASIFNPARLKLNAMQREMPVKYWKNLPEAHLIPALIANAANRVDTMVRQAPTTPRKRTPAPARKSAAPSSEASPSGDESIATLRKRAKGCRACPLWAPATQTVFGEGSEDARVFVIGEQPGDQEDLSGHPFVGPAGQLFDRALLEAGVDRGDLYVTNTVKHFKFELRGKRRLHKRANAAEQAACRPWLEAELARIKPARILCLGAMAAQAIFGRSFKLMAERGKWHALSDDAKAMATVHPSYLLRVPDEDERHRAYAEFVRDLKRLKAAM
jgi:probable DNA metabolism protein